ncbi:uridine phosphorylase [Aeropyrum pernix]|uniref:uridine phosphorylase n=1 Tax=Aeropyrum pernix TaxID=56636 RepID=UPI0010374209|nr:uridine phosphorylase [Aeropyrum pernix]
MGDESLRSAARPEGEGGLQYHLRVRRGDVARYVLLPGDPERTDLIARLWDEARLVAHHREYRTWTGFYKGTPISVTSTGIGSPSTAIAVEELLRVGAETFIRVGTMGGIREDLRPGTLVIGSAAVRMEGTSGQYAPRGFPAAASYDVVAALVEAAEALGVRYEVGVVASTDSFYLGQGRPGYGGYMTPEASEIIPLLRSAGVLGFEMEASALFTLSQLYGARAGCVCAVVANRVSGEFVVNAGVEDAARVASEAVAILAGWDREREKRGKKWFYPSLACRRT